LLRRSFMADDLIGITMVVVGPSESDATRSVVCSRARALGVLHNGVDAPADSDFIFPGIINRDPVLVAVSTLGRAPSLAAALRQRIEGILPLGVGKLAQVCGGFRGRVRLRHPDATTRRRFWQRFVSTTLGASEFDEEHLETAIEAALLKPDDGQRHGRVDLVGAGPGDPGMLTVRALQSLQSADVVAFDRLVAPEIRGLARRDALMLSVGKQTARHEVSQEETNKILVQHARAGAHVCRLKGGDPLVFGRGGEELEFLLDAGIETAVIPGITAATGCAAYAGIPLTHRDCAQSVVFITAHPKRGTKLQLDWSNLAAPNQTVVVYMGVRMLPKLARELQAAGLPPATPAAIVVNGTRSSGEKIFGTIEQLPRRARARGVKSPALVIIGEVVARAYGAQNAELAAISRAADRSFAATPAVA